jgi:hypothetical protein
MKKQRKDDAARRKAGLLKRRVERLLKTLPPKSTGDQERIAYLEKKIQIKDDVLTELAIEPAAPDGDHE